VGGINLCLDAGNSRIKIGIFEGRSLKETYIIAADDVATVKRLLSDTPIKKAMIGAVGVDSKVIHEVSRNVNCIQASVKLKAPITNAYSTPSTLGIDRWAGAIGASQLFPKKSLMIIDSGTCTTTDWVSASGEFQGGRIAPGLAMRLKAMHHYTSKLPEIAFEPSEIIPSIGNSTRLAMLSGAVNGLVDEVSGCIHEWEEKETGIIVTTGGDGAFLEKRLKSSKFAAQIFNEPHLVLLGLNELLLLNAE
jgi:type III pantothenate kinase